jgi:hypothetical protein
VTAPLLLLFWLALAASVFAETNLTLTAHAGETNTPAASTTNAPPSAVTSNALPDTITINGTTYSNVTWHSVTPTTVTIFHQTGVATIPLAQLPPEVQKQFGYDSVKVKEFEDSQKAKGLIIYRGQWMTPEDGQRVYQDDLDAEDVKRRENDAIQIDTKVIQVLPDGLLCSGVSYGVGVYNYMSGYNVADVEIVLTHCSTDGVVDGTIVDATVIPDGTVSYETVLGVSKTVKKYRCLRYTYYSR